MNFWIYFWTYTLIAALAIFAALAVVVSIGGLFDIKTLFRSIEAKHAEGEQDAEADGS